jgi:steroid delta-isomerase-like uncharacterized protein
MSEQTKAVARRFFEEAFTGGDLDVLDELIAADAVEHDPQDPFPEHRGPEGARRSIAFYREAFPDLRFEIEEQVAEGDLVVSRFTATGTQDGDLPDLPATHRQGKVTGISILRVEDGRIAESWTNWDTLGLFQQLGALPAPAH